MMGSRRAAARKRESAEAIIIVGYNSGSDGCCLFVLPDDPVLFAFGNCQVQHNLMPAIPMHVAPGSDPYRFCPRGAL